ncbi:MAG: UvrD-helicase domain-containing protein, partial [Bacteroidota bacterium]
MPAYLEQLNEVQREAVIHTAGACMIIAGAGAGKTKVLTYRIAYLLQAQAVDPSQILALTFTNKAAYEMRQRLEKMAGHAARNVWLGTFHSIFTKILRAEAAKLGYPPNFSIYDATDSKSLIKSIVKTLDLDDQIYNPSTVLRRISGAKNRLITAQQYASNPIAQADDESARRPRLREIFLGYAERCFKADAMDFDDLLLNTYLLFNQHIEVLYKYQERFRYILIDEFQDTNVAQYAIIKDLASIHQNICVVGDDAQSIYAFRGANIDNILNFERDHAGLKLIKLEQNYRSTQHIVQAANAIIRNNKAQLKKTAWTANELGEPLGLIRATVDAEEGRLVAASIFETKVHKQLSNADFAVLYRTNSQSRIIEEALRKINLPYRIVGGMSFYQRKEVKDLLAYLRFLVNHNDEEALRRIINLPKRGIGPSSIDKMLIAAADHGVPLWEVVHNAKNFLRGKVADSVEDFAHMIQSAALVLHQKDAYEIASSVAKKSGLLKMLYEDKTIEGLTSYENVQELLNGIKAFTTNPEQEDVSLATFLQEVALATSLEEADQDDADKVTLMTAHAAKGLEFKYVYIVGMEEDLFPSAMTLYSTESLEEERRLFYVAITRAQQKVFLAYALSRYRFGRLRQCELSRFVEEIDPAYLQVSNPPSRHVTDHTTTHYASRLIDSKHSTQQRKYRTPPQVASHSQPNSLASIKPGVVVE